MRNAFRPANLWWLVLMLAAPATAQNGLTSAPAPAVTGPAYNLSVGYTNVMMSIPGAKNVNMNGVDGSASISFRPRWDLVVESSYARTQNVLGTQHLGYILNNQAGAVFYPWEHRNTRMLVRGLAGGALIDGAVPDSSTRFFHGWSLRPSYTAGAGVEQALSNQFLLRFNGDYLRTSFYDGAGVEAGQNNVRLTVSLVFHLRQSPHRSRQVR